MHCGWWWRQSLLRETLQSCERISYAQINECILRAVGRSENLGEIAPLRFLLISSPYSNQRGVVYAHQITTRPPPSRIFRPSYGPVFIGYTYKLGWAIFGTTRKNFSLRQSEYFPKAFTTIIIKKKRIGLVSQSQFIFYTYKKRKRWKKKKRIYPSFIFR